MGLPLVPMTVSCPADTKLFVRGTTATRKRHSAQFDARAVRNLVCHKAIALTRGSRDSDPTYLVSRV